MKRMKCKDCKYFRGNEDPNKLSMCTYHSSWEITKHENDCWFIPAVKELTCGDCARYLDDPGCFGCSADESAHHDGELCRGFCDIKENELYSILSFWKSRGIYDRGRINSLIDAFEKAYDDLAKQ